MDTTALVFFRDSADPACKPVMGIVTRRHAGYKDQGHRPGANAIFELDPDNDRVDVFLFAGRGATVTGVIPIDNDAKLGGTCWPTTAEGALDAYNKAYTTIQASAAKPKVAAARSKGDAAGKLG